MDSFLIGNYLPLTIFSLALFKTGIGINEDNLAKFKHSDAGGIDIRALAPEKHDEIKLNIKKLRNLVPRANLYENNLSVKLFEIASRNLPRVGLIRRKQ